MIVSYIRVSTNRQGVSGLGLEAQRASVQAYANQIGATVVAEYREVETGTCKRKRPELERALSHAKLSKATLVVAKLDRLSRNVAFTSALMESGVDFVACDNPHANRLTIHILAAVAEDEARVISERTKAALQAAKARGAKLGSSRPGHWQGREARRIAGAKAGAKASAESRRTVAQAAYGFLVPVLVSMRDRDALSYRQIAARLNADGHTTTSGKPWTPTAALRVYRMARDAA